MENIKQLNTINGNIKNIEVAIINEFIRCKYLNEGEANEKQIEILNAITDKSYSLITEQDIYEIDDISKVISETLKKYNLSFTDSRCYSYLNDAVYSMIYR